MQKLKPVIPFIRTFWENLSAYCSIYRDMDTARLCSVLIRQKKIGNVHRFDPFIIPAGETVGAKQVLEK